MDWCDCRLKRLLVAAEPAVVKCPGRQHFLAPAVDAGSHMEHSWHRFNNLLEQAGQPGLWYAYGLSFLSALILILIYALVFTPHFSTCDDVVMALTSSGCALFAKPDEHLLYTHVFIGLALKWLYGLNASIPWYGGYLLAAHVIAMACVLAVFLLQGSIPLRLLLFLVFFLVSELSCLTNLQFTTTAMIVAQAGALTMLYCLEKSELSGGKQLALMSLSLALMLAGVLIRQAGGELSILLCALFLFARYLRLPKPDTRILVGCGLLVVTLVVGELLWRWNDSYYQTERRWQGFSAYDCAKQKFTDYARADARSPAVRAVGWSENDLAMMENFLPVDAQVFSLPKLAGILSGSKPYRHRLKFGYVMNELWQIARDRFTVPCLLALAGSIWILDRRRLGLRGGTAFLASVLAVIILLICFLKLPQRVYLPIVSCATLFLLFSVDVECLRAAGQKLSNLARRPRLLAIALGISAAVFGVGQLYALHRSASDLALSKNRMLKAAISELRPTSGQLYVLVPPLPWMGGVLPLENPAACLGSMNLLPIPFLPLEFGQQRMREFGATSFDELLRLKNVFFVQVAGSYSLERVKIFVGEHYRLPARFELAYRYLPLGMTFYRTTDSPERPANLDGRPPLRISRKPMSSG